jgi:hypothetical protein
MLQAGRGEAEADGQVRHMYQLHTALLISGLVFEHANMGCSVHYPYYAID